MTTAPRYRFENVWESKSEELREEIKAFWRRHRALPTVADADARAEQVLFVVRDLEHAIGAARTCGFIALVGP